jgi:hypothetical protein
MAWSTRIWLGVVALFWLAMSALLWRSEFGSQRQFGSSIPASVVWKKMLTAPDHSTLEIRHGTNRIGYCRWRPEVGQEFATGTRMSEEEPIEGMVHQLAYYSLEVEGNVALRELPTRLSFSAGLKLDTNYAWQTYETRVTIRPDVYELFANASEQTVQLHVDAGGDRFNRKFRFSDFQNPQKLLQEFGGPMLPAMLGAIGVPLSTNKMSAASLGLRWEARNDSILVGNNRVRVYRLQTRLLDRYRVTLFVSPVGEILRAELPADIVLVNDQLTGLRNTSEHD